MADTKERKSLSTPTEDKVATRSGRWVQIIAVFVALLYCAEVSAVWLKVTNDQTGDDGIAWIFRSAPDGYGIYNVAKRSPASRAGLRQGDVILAVDGTPASNEAAFRHALLRRQPGASTTFLVRRASASPAAPVEEITLTLEPRLVARPDDIFFLVVQAVVGILFLAVAVFVAIVRSTHPASRLLLIMASGVAFGMVINSWDDPTKNVWPLQALILLVMVAQPAAMHLFLSFPAPHPFLTRLRKAGPNWLRRLGGGTAVLYTVFMAATLSVLMGPPTSWIWLIALLLIIWLVGMSYAMYQNYRNASNPLSRAQLKWIVWAVVILILATAQRVVILGFFVESIEETLEKLSFTVVMGGLGVLPTAVGLSILRYRLFDVSAVLRATVRYALLGAILLVGYLAVTLTISLGMASLLGNVAAQPQADAARDQTVAMLAVLVVAALAHPVQVRLQRALDRIVYRDRLARQEFLQEATEQLSNAQPKEEVAFFLTSHSAQQLKLNSAWLAIRGGDPSWCPPSAPVEPLLKRARGWTRPTLVVMREDLEAVGLDAVVSDEPEIAPWYDAGVRLFVPLCTGSPEVGRITSAASGADDRGEVIGIWALGARQSGELFERDDLEALAQVGRMAAVLLDYARLYKDQIEQEIARRELTKAREIQQGLVPQYLPYWPGQLEIAARLRPARETSGDFYDVLSLAPSVTAIRGGSSSIPTYSPLQIVVGDVKGKGIAAALVAGMARATLRGVTRSNLGLGMPSLAATLRVANELLHRDLGREGFVACALAVIEPFDLNGNGLGGLRLHLANAGQIPPYLCRDGKAVELVPNGQRLPLGALPDVGYDEMIVDLEPGDVVVFTSDGLAEAPAVGLIYGGGSHIPINSSGPKPGEFYSFERLAASAAHWAAMATSADEVMTGMWDDLTAWCEESSLQDDATLLVLRIPTEKEPERSNAAAMSN